VRKPLSCPGGRGVVVLLAVVLLAVAAPCVDAGEVARGELAILGLGLEVQRDPVVAAVDVPSYVQTRFGEVAPAPGLAALGDLTGPGLDTAITLATIPGQRFAIPALREKGDYLLQNVRLVGPSGEFLQQAVPSVATIRVTEVLTTNVRVRQLTADELRERGILLDDRNYEAYEYTFIFSVDGQQVEIPYPVIVDRRTRQIVPAIPPAFRMLLLPTAQKPPRFTPPYIEPFDLSPGGGSPAGEQKDREPGRAAVSLPAALVIPNGFGVLHQFFAVVLQVSNSAPEDSRIRLDSVTGTIHSPLSMRVAKQVPAVALGQPVPVVDERTGATFLVAGAQGSAEWTLEALKAGTHTVDIDVRATYQKPGEEDFAIGGRVSTSIVVSDPRFHVNFSHPDVVRKDDKYTAFAFVTNLTSQRQRVELRLSDIPACTSGSHANNVCRYEGSDLVTLDLGPGEMVPVPYKLVSRVTGKVYAAAGAANDEAVAVSVNLTMGVSVSGIPLSPATLVMPHYTQFLPAGFVDANMQLLGLGYSLATSPLTQYTARKPRVITTDVFRRAQQIALAGQRIFSVRRDRDANDPAENRDAFVHLSLDLLGNIERVDQHAVMPELAEWDELRRSEEAGRTAARGMARQLEANAPPAPQQFVDDYASTASHRTPFLFAYVHGPPVAGVARPYALSVRGLTTQTAVDVPAEATGGWVRTLAYGELMSLAIGGEAGELAMAGRWSEDVRITVLPSAATFALHLLYPDAESGTTLRADILITNARSGVPVSIDVARGDRTLIVNGASAIPLVNAVDQAPLRVLGAAQDLHLDGGGHVVSLLFNRPIQIADDRRLRDLLALTIKVPKASYTATRRNNPADPGAELQIPAARLQEDGRVLIVTFDKTLSRNAEYAIAVEAIADRRTGSGGFAATGIVPRVDNDRPAAILTGKVLNGDNTPVPNLLVRLLMQNARVQGLDGFAELVQYDVGGADGRYLFEYVPRDLDQGLLGEYNLLTEAPDGRQASLTGSVRLPGEVHYANLVFLGRGKARGQVRWDDGTPIPNVNVAAGSSLFGGMFGTTADASGFYEMDGLPVGPLVFSAVDPQGRMVYATNAIRTAGEVITQDLVVVRTEGPPPGVATVRVQVLRSDTMQPVPGALVGVGSEHVQLMTQNADAHGRCEFRGVPAGLLSIIAADYAISRHGAAVEVELRGDQIHDQTLVLQVPDATTRYAWLEGVVTRDDPAAPADTTKDQPVDGPVLSIFNLPPVTGNADGTFLYPDIPTTFSGRWIQVFDPQTSRTGWFRVPTLSEGANRFSVRLSSLAPEGYGTFRVRVYGGRGEPVSGARVFAPGYPPASYSNQGGGVYERREVRVPQRDTVMVVMSDPAGPYGEQYAQGSTRVDFDGQVGVTDVRLPGSATVVVKLEMEQPCSTPPCYAQAIGPVAMTYTAWDDYMQKPMPRTVVGDPDPTTNLVTFARVPAKQDVLFETVRHPAGYARQTIRLSFDGDVRNVNLRLSTISSVTGRVFAHDGITPVAGATVRISIETASYASALTRQDGSFELAAIPANTFFEVIAELQQDGVFRTARVSGKTPESGGPVADLVAVMREQSSIEGQVVNGSTGTVVPLAHYWLRELAWPYRSIGSAQEPLRADINGRFIVTNVFTGPYRITAVAPDNQELRGDFQGTLIEEGDSSQRDVRVLIGGAGTGAISITVVDPLIAFEAVGNAEVALLRDGAAFDFTTTNDAGVAYFEQVPVGPAYAVFAYSKQRGRSGRSPSFPIAAGELTSRSVQLEFLGIVSGSVTDPETDPPNLPVRGQPVSYSGPVGLRATTDAGGNFEFNGVPEGGFTLQAWELASQRTAEGPSGLFISKLVPEQRNVRLELERMGTLTVKVYLPNDIGGPGEPAPLVEVTASQCIICNLYTPDYPYYRSAQGNPVAFPRMFRRVGYGLEVRELGGEARTVRAGGSFPAGAVAHEQVIVLPQSGTVEALILDGTGKPVADAKVTINGASQATVYSGIDGRASLPGMPVGWYSLEATKGAATAAAGGQLRSRSQPLRLTLNLGTNVTVTGFVEAEEGVGRPSPRTRVLADVTTRLMPSLRLETLTDDAGNFTFTGIPVGGTSISLLYFGPDDTTIGARPPPRAIGDGATGTIILSPVKLDATPPRILAIEPSANASNVSPSTPVTVTFSEPVKPEFLTASVFELVDTDSPPEVIQSTVYGSIRPDRTYVVTILPPDPPPTRTFRLKSNMLYRFSIPAGIPDLTGNGLRTAIGTSFTTVNYTEPAVVNIDPPESVPLGEQATFRIKFNKAVDIHSFDAGVGGLLTLDRLDGYRGNAIESIPIARNLDPADPSTIIVAPVGVAIAESAYYRITIAGVRDTLQPPNVQKEARLFDFFSFDRAKPVISIVSPAGAGEKLVAGVLYSPTIGTADADVAYVDWLDAGGTSIARAKTKPFAYSFVAPSNATSFTLKAVATDLSGNSSDPAATMTWQVTPNEAPSEIALTNDASSVYPGALIASEVRFKDEGVSVTITLELRGVALDGSEMRQLLGSQKVTRTSTAVPFPDASFSWTVPLTLKEGSATVVATVTDSVNHAASGQASITVLLDQTRPVVVSFLPQAESRYRFGVSGSYTIELKARDEETGLARATFTVGGVEVFNGPGTLAGGVTTFRKDVTVPPKNADTRVPVVVTAFDHRGNAVTETHDVIYERVDDSSLPRAAWVTPVDGAVLPSNQAGWLTTLRVRASDDVKVTRVRFESPSLAAPIDLTAPTEGADIFASRVALGFPPDGSPVVITAVVSDGDPAHDVELPIAVSHVAAAPAITGEININPTNAAQYADKSVLIRGNVRVYVSTPLTLKDLMLVDGAVLSTSDETKLDLTVTDRLFVDADSRIDVSGKGFLGGLRTREDNSFTNPSTSGRSPAAPGASPFADGSYGGRGGSGSGSTNATYGSLTAPSDFGSGGGAISSDARGGNGGGALTLRAAHLAIAGAIRSDGESLATAGSGGSIILRGGVLVTGPSTRITANGGDGASSLDSDRGGGGGRIAVIAAARLDIDATVPVLQARGGRNGSLEGSGYVDGGAGTVLVNRSLLVSSFDERFPSTAHRSGATPLDGLETLDAISIGPRSLARFDVPVPANVTLDPTAVMVGPNDLPAISGVSTVPAAGSDVPQHTSILATFDATSVTGIREVRALDAAVYPRFVPGLSTAQLAIPIAATQAPGPIPVKLRVTDRAGRVAESETLSFSVVANTAPVIESLDTVAQTYAGRTIAVTAAARDDVAVRSLSLTATAGSVTPQSPQTPTQQTMTRVFMVSIPPAEPSGPVVLTLAASDDFPNRPPTSDSRTVTIMKDVLPPAVRILQPVASQQVDEGAGATFLVDVDATDAEVAVRRVTATLDGVTHELSLVGGRWQATLAVPSVDGTELVAKTLSVRAFDYEGNAADATVVFHVRPLIDPNAPVLAWSCASPGAMYPAGHEVAFRVTATPANAANGVNSIEVTIGTGAPITAARIGITDIYEAKFTIPPGVAEGERFDVRVVARSTAGNEATLLGTFTVTGGVTINTASTIAANDVAFEDQSFVVTSGGVLTIAGPHRLRNVVVLNGGRVVQQAIDPLRADELQVARVYVACGGSIDVTGLGLETRVAYPGAGVPDHYAGGSHIGRGATWWRSSGGVFGSVYEPKEPGGGGNASSASEGSGGGMVRLRATGEFIVDGTVRANGALSSQGSGAGGSIWIIASALAGAGQIEARGAAGNFGAGGGGAIALDYGTTSGNYTVDASGATTTQDGARTSAPGTIVRNGLALTIDGRSIPLSSTSPTVLPSFGHARVATAASNEVTLVDRRFVSPSLAGHRVRAFAPDGSVRGTFRLRTIANHPNVVLLDTWAVVLTQDATSYDGWLMYAPAGLGGRKFVAVRRFGTNWQYDNDTNFVTFVPAAGDVLFATLTTSGGRVRALDPLWCDGTCASIEGINTAEVIAGQIDTDTWIVDLNVGGSGFDAGEIVLRPDARGRAFALSSGAATLGLEKLSGSDVQAGDRIQGFYAFNTIELRNARVVTDDLVEGTISKDAVSSLSSGNAAPPVVDPSKLSIVPGLDGPVLLGAPGAVADGDGPIEIAVRNGVDARAPRPPLHSDDHIALGEKGGFSVAHQENARSGAGSTAAGRWITEGHLAFTPSTASEQIQVGLSPNNVVANYDEPEHNTFRLSANGTYQIWANGSYANRSGTYAANTAFRIEKRTASIRWFVDEALVHEITSNVPASVVFELSMAPSVRGEIGSIVYSPELPARAYSAKVEADGSFRVRIAGSPGDPILVRARDRHRDSLESEPIQVSYPIQSGVQSLVFSPAETTGGRTSTGTVTLRAQAGPDGARVLLKSGSAIVAVPESITIAPGATSGAFTATTTAVLGETEVPVTATYGGSGTSTALRVVKDTIAPAVTITSPAPETEYIEAQSAKIDVRATAVDQDSGVRRATILFDGQSYAMTLSAGVWSALVPVPFVEGTVPVRKELVVNAEDNSGNVGTSIPTPIVIQPLLDNTPPTIAALCAIGGAMFPVGYNAPIRVRAQAPNVNNPVQKVEIAITGPNGIAATLPAAGAGNDLFEAIYTVPDTEDSSLFTIRATATTASGSTAVADGSFRAVRGAVEIRTNVFIDAATRTYDGKSVVVFNGATVTIDGSHSFDRLIVLGNVTHPISGRVNVTVNAAYVACGGSFDATARGRSSAESYPGTVPVEWGSGGSHIGRGGLTGEGRVFGSVHAPSEAGGGGNPGNGRGGGVIRLRASSLSVDGAVRADGQNLGASGEGGGAGGSVWITAVRIEGSGTISANGGDACEAGGGGALSVEYTDTASRMPVLSARAGVAGCGGRIGGAGTVRVAGPTSVHGDVTIDSLGSGMGTTELPALGNGVAQPGSGGAVLVTGRTADIAAFFAGHWVRIATPEGTVRGTWRIESISGRTVTLAGASGIMPGDTWRGLYRFDTLTVRGGAILLSKDPIETAVQVIAAPLATDSVTSDALHLTSGAVLSHPVGGSLQVRVANEIRIDAGASIDATALGYHWSSRYPGQPVVDYGDGGSHIGRGGEVDEGRTYGSISAPAERGGGGYPGDARGGGLIRLQAGSLVVNGAIRADGQNIGGSGEGGGAGGSVWITASRITGTGSIVANGGDACEAGGGGAIAIEYTDASSVLPLVTARPGVALCSGRVGGAGSVLVAGPASTFGDVTFETGTAGPGITELPRFGSGIVQSGSGGAVLVTDRAQAFIPPFFVRHWVRVTAPDGTVRGRWRIRSIDGPATVTLDGASGITAGDRWEGLYRFDAVTLRNVQFVSADRVESRTHETQDFVRLNQIATGSLRVRPSSVLTHWDGAALEISASEEVRIDTNGAIDASALGYSAATRYPSQPALDYGDGGSHIGRGGNVGAGSTYGSVYRPAEGGGGGNPGPARGGGVVQINASAVIIDGAVKANGSAATGGSEGGGAGGSVRVRAQTITGRGWIAAEGGRGCEAGGGGALSLEYTSPLSALPLLSAKAGIADCGGRVGGAGSVYTWGPSSTFGALLVDNTGRGAGTTELPSLGKGIAQAGTAGATLVTDRTTDIPQFFVGHWVEIATKGKWRIEKVTGRTVTLAPNANETISLAAGDAWEGIYRFDAVTTREGILVSTDRIDVPATAGAALAQPSQHGAPSGPRDSSGADAQPERPAVASLMVLTLDPAVVRGGGDLLGIVTLTADAPLGGAVVLLASDGPEHLSLPETVFIPHGTSTGVFEIRTKPVDETTAVVITARWGASRTATLTLTGGQR